MTKKEAIRELKILKENYWDDDGYGHETKQYDDTMSALDMAIKALEQEHILVLDKIRAEIEALPKTYPYVNHFDMYVKEDDVKKIIDKYKAGSEAKNEHNNSQN